MEKEKMHRNSYILPRISWTLVGLPNIWGKGRRTGIEQLYTYRITYNNLQCHERKLHTKTRVKTNTQHWLLSLLAWKN